MIDGAGRERKVDVARLGSKESGDYNGHVAASTLVSGIPTGAELQFDKVSSDVTSIALLDVACRVDNKPLKVQFRKIPISVRQF